MTPPRLSRVLACLLALLCGYTPSVGAAEGVLVNLSARLRLPAGNAPMIAGFVVQGTAPQPLLIRATGPSLAQYGVSGFAPRPVLTVFNATGSTIASNTAWDATDAANIAAVGAAVSAFPLLPSTGSLADSAIVLALDPGAYTVHVGEQSGVGGVSVIEVYAVDSSASRLVNISMRGAVGTGEDLLAAGFVILGGPREILARGVGPTLRDFGVTSVIDAPELTLRTNANTVINTNAGWGWWTSPISVTTVANVVHAFPLTNHADAAMTLSLQPGVYTLQVTDRNVQPGEALIEVYEAPTPTGAYLARTHLDLNWNSHHNPTRGSVPLTHLPMRLTDVAGIVPLGLMVGGHVTPIDHIYFAPLDPNSALGAYDVFIVADGQLTEISTRPNHQGTGFEHRVVLQHTGSFYSYYDLIDVLDPAIMAQIPAGALDNGRIFRGPISVSGGQRLGAIGGKTLDFANVNTETFLPGFIVPDHYIREPWKLFTVDTFECYDEPLRSQLLAKNPRVAAPRGGKIDHDIEGTLIGNWFRVGTNGYAGVENDPEGYASGHLAIAPFVLDPTHFIVSLGSFQGQPQQFGVNGNTPDPATVTAASGMIKYELIPPANQPPPVPINTNPQIFGTVLFQVLPDNQLRMEAFPGQPATAVSGFTSAAKIYER